VHRIEVDDRIDRATQDAGGSVKDFECMPLEVYQERIAFGPLKFGYIATATMTGPDRIMPGQHKVWCQWRTACASICKYKPMSRAATD